MNFQNFYTSIFNNKMNARKFSINLIYAVFFILFFSFILNISDYNITNNDIIKHYQLDKINKEDFKEINTIIVGDSSGGNGFDSAYFDELSGLKSKNLCLTGSWGIVGSLGIAKLALNQNQNIKNVIIIHTLDIWNRNFPKESFLELFPLQDTLKNIDLTSVFSFYFNPKEIWWHIKFIKNDILQNNSKRQIDLSNDYILQGDKKYSNNKLFLNPNKNLNNIKLSLDKINELNLLDDFCKKNSLNCIFLNGPIHKELMQESDIFNIYLKTVIKSKFKYINFYPNIFEYENSKMGNSVDHIDTSYKKESTKNYFQLIENDLDYK